MPEYAVVQTIRDSTGLDSQPVDARTLLATDNYPRAVQFAREHRVSRYRHRDTGQARDLTEAQVMACGFSDEELFEWMSRAVLEQVVSYAVVQLVGDVGGAAAAG